MEQRKEPQIVGLDVSKAWLDGYLPETGRRRRVSNDAAGVRTLVRSLGDHAGCLVVMEASGGYERTAHGELWEVDGCDRCSTAGARLARGMGLEAKTDRATPGQAAGEATAAGTSAAGRVSGAGRDPGCRAADWRDHRSLAAARASAQPEPGCPRRSRPAAAGRR